MCVLLESDPSLAFYGIDETVIWGPNFIRSKAGVMVPTPHTFLIKYVCNLMTSYLNPSVKCHWYFMANVVNTYGCYFSCYFHSKYQTIKLSDPGTCLRTCQILSYLSQPVLKTIRVSGYNITFYITCKY